MHNLDLGLDLGLGLDLNLSRSPKIKTKIKITIKIFLFPLHVSTLMRYEKGKIGVEAGNGTQTSRKTGSRYWE